MVSIGICGASGCGKSLLVRQLAAKNSTVALLEGEIGFFPPEVIREISQKKNPLKLFKFFADKLNTRFCAAQKLSKQKVTCFVDGCAASVPAHLVLEKEEFVPALKKTYAHMKTDVDVIILLTCSKSSFDKYIKIRARAHEQNAEYMSRSIKVQNEFVRLLKGKDNVLTINRDKYDFYNFDDISAISKKILAFAQRHK